MAGLMTLALSGWLLWWGRPVDGVISPRVVRVELLYSMATCLAFLAAITMLVMGT